MADNYNGRGTFYVDDINTAQSLNIDPLYLDYLGKLNKSDAQAQLVGDTIAYQRSSAEAQKQRDFEERMSNTSRQRGVSDMLAAGINPALAYQRGGASTPSGVAASVHSGSMRTSSGASQLVGGLMNTAIATAGGIAGKAIGASIASSGAAQRVADTLEYDMLKTTLKEDRKDFRQLQRINNSNNEHYKDYEYRNNPDWFN